MKNKSYSEKLNYAIRVGVLAALLLLAPAVLFGGCGKDSGRAASFESTRFLMDTVVTIRLEAGPSGGIGEEELREAALAALARMEEVAAAADRYQEGGSDLRRLSEAAGSGELVEVSEDLWRMQSRVIALNETAAARQPLSSGLVNTAMGPLIDLWAEARQSLVLPSAEDIAAALALADMSKIALEPAADQAGSGACLADFGQGGAENAAADAGPGFGMALGVPGMGLDFGAVAKGYAVQAAWQTLKDTGLDIRGIIDAGGNLMTLGEKPGGGSWSVGIANPADQSRLLAALAMEADTVAATSGDYQRYAEIGGKRYHHLLSPKDGQPARENRSATAICGDGMAADYYSTLLFLLPPKEALALAEATEGLEAVIVSGEGKIYVSQGLRDRLTWNQDLGGCSFAEV